MQEIERILKQPFLIYGAGAVARMAFPYLLNQEDYECKGIALTDLDSFHVEEWDHFSVPIRSISEWTQDEIDKNTLILIATSEQHHHEIKEICQSFGFSNLLPLTTALNDAITKRYFEKYFKDKNIDTTQEILQIGNLKLVNLLRRTDIPNGVNMLGQLGDFVFPDIFNDETLIAEGPYEYGEVRLKEGDVVFDCGSNFGVFSVYAASKGCQSYAFEPTPALNDLIKQQSALNGEKIHPVLMAVSDAEGEAVFHVDEYSSGGSSLLKRAESTSDIKVKLTSLDQFVETHHLDKVDFIKADIEGAERLLLKGAKNILKQHQPVLALCTYHLPDDKEVLSNLILEANPHYKIVNTWQKLFAYVPKKVT